jgi:hypothetical protein
VKTLPRCSLATQNDVDGHDTPCRTVRPPWTVLSRLARVHVDAPPVGFVDVSTFPYPSTAAQNDADAHDTAYGRLLPFWPRSKAAGAVHAKGGVALADAEGSTTSARTRAMAAAIEPSLSHVVAFTAATLERSAAPVECRPSRPQTRPG